MRSQRWRNERADKEFFIEQSRKITIRNQNINLGENDVSIVYYITYSRTAPNPD